MRNVFLSLFAIAFRPSLGYTQLLIQFVPAVLFPGIKRPSREADASPPSSDKVKNARSYYSTSPYV
jgi:hypothetical protein